MPVRDFVNGLRGSTLRWTIPPLPEVSDTWGRERARDETSKQVFCYVTILRSAYSICSCFDRHPWEGQDTSNRIRKSEDEAEDVRFVMVGWKPPFWRERDANARNRTSSSNCSVVLVSTRVGCHVQYWLLPLSQVWRFYLLLNSQSVSIDEEPST